MSSLITKGNAAGTGSVTLESPNTNSDFTISLPASTGTVVLTGTTPTLNGITFPATQVPSADANTLDDYEEGTWTPTALFSSSNGNRSYINQVGRYTKIGNLVYIQGFLEFSETTASGNLSIGGLPFAANTATANYSAATVFVNNLSGVSGQIQFLIGADVPANEIFLYYSGTGTRTNVNNTNTGTSAQFAFSICYQV